ncbi:hypothetical protein VSH64_14070 [Amycolatopsis rhabdoformis]|uniref:Uncharacterized protein n=1 Tax=Amycolatopsis rhabdoformis TaxID=1448059 RepID=A0ABZ1IFM1_9PSEU|nr:hypothetical protein [Amycolatopsis rhabdoformis]WSE33226.1 hypothetical protein VSH64_14070 [Amycolatopsis rhabdoformis]
MSSLDRLQDDTTRWGKLGCVNVDPPRPLTTRERATLDLLLSPDFPGAEELRSQVSSAVVVGRCDCGCPTIDFQVDAAAPPARVPWRLAPSELETLPTGGEPPDQVMLFVEDGRLSCLEYVAFDQRPAQWPDPRSMRVVGP